jgi:hypothetical protein
MTERRNDAGLHTPHPSPLDHPVWPLWLSFKRHFPTLTLPVSTFTTPGAWGWFGNDVVSGLRRNPSTARAFALVAGASPDLFNALSALATLNQRRQELGFQMLAIFYVTVPVTLFVSAGEIAPDALLAFADSQRRTLIGLTATFILVTLVYLASLWRARQMVQVLDLIRLERGLEPVSTVELREG